MKVPLSLHMLVEVEAERAPFRPCQQLVALVHLGIRESDHWLIVIHGDLGFREGDVEVGGWLMYIYCFHEELGEECIPPFRILVLCK